MSSIYLNYQSLSPGLFLILGVNIMMAMIVQRRHLPKRKKNGEQHPRNPPDQAINYQEYASRIELLHQIDMTLAESYEEKSIILMCTVGIQSLLDNSSVAYYRCDEQLGIATKYAQQNDSEFQGDFPETIAIASLPSLQPNFFHNTVISLDNNPNTVEHDLLTELGLKTLMALPVYRDLHLIGCVMVGDVRHPYPLDDHDMLLVNGVVSQTRIALERCHVFEQLREAEQIKSEMIRMASHDLRTPLSQISGFLELFRRTLPPLSDEQQLYLSNIERSLSKSKQLLNDVLNLDRVESYRPDTWQDLDLLPILHSVLHDVETRILLKKHRLSIDLPDTIPPITGSDVQLEQLFMNLLDNAIKYTPEGGHIQVRGWCEERYFVFEVEDDGYGIPEEKQPFIFERFFRVEAPGTESITGTGLGLSLVKAIAQRHDGEVFFTSTLGAGSTFGCKLPFSL